MITLYSSMTTFDGGLCRQHVRDDWPYCANEAASKCPPITGKWVHWTAEDYWWEQHCVLYFLTLLMLVP